METVKRNNAIKKIAIWAVGRAIRGGIIKCNKSNEVVDNMYQVKRNSAILTSQMKYLHFAIKCLGDKRKTLNMLYQIHSQEITKYKISTKGFQICWLFWGVRNFFLIFSPSTSFISSFKK